MIKEKILKVLTAAMCITTLIMPHTSVVLATALTNQTPNDTNTIHLISSEYHEGGAESSESLSDEALEIYDTKQYKYTFGGTSGTDILKILRADDKGEIRKDETTGESIIGYLYSDAFYCLDGNNSFPSIDLDGDGDNSIEYTRTIADFFEENPSTLNLSTENYDALCWLFNNMYLRKQMTPEQRAAQKDAMIQNAFKARIEAGTETVDDIKSLLTDDDIEVIQQWAIWYFTNNGEVTLQDIPFTNDNNTLPVVDLTTITQPAESMEVGRYELATALYQYLVTTALSHKDDEKSSTSVYPTIANKEVVGYTISGTNFVVGPFKVTAPSADLSSSDYTITLTDGTSEILSSAYTIKDADGNVIDKKVNEIFGDDYYIYLPVSGNIRNVKLNISYTPKIETKASVWSAGDPNYQPLVLLTKEAPTLEPDSVTVTLETSPDFALRKYIVAVNGTEVTDRAPTVDISKLKAGTEKTAEYKHKKEAVEVKPGDTVTFRIAIYNEGNVAGKVTGIVDYLPSGLEYIADNETNKRYGWTISEDGRVATTTVTQNTEIPAFGNSLSGAYVDIVCKIADNAASGAIFTNISEIILDNVDDRDSTTDSMRDKISTLDLSAYKGHSENKADLTDSSYYYKGYEDDDDFEKVKVVVPEKKAFDLSLQKFITKVNGTAVTTSREPVVDTTPLKNGETNAKYTTVKTPILVQKGDIVTYTIRVYNEGEAAGFAQSVADYIPAGLGYLVNYKGNVDNYWALPTDSTAEIVSLKTVSNKDYSKILNTTDEISVAKGKVKITTTALSSEISKNNVIAAFDGTDKLSYKDVEVTCVVLSDANLKNIAEIVKHANENGKETEESGNPIPDRDSVPNTVDPDNYPGNDENQDDNDYDVLTMKKFDLSLQKFITKLNDKDITDRVPKITLDENKNIKYEHPSTALEVNNGDTVVYTIRVYNEGEIDGYAAEISDNIPSGLTFDSNNETNKKYGWIMYDSNGNVTTDSSKATEIRTDYLSKEKAEARKESALLKAFDSASGNLFYLDVQVAFKVNTKTSNDTITNIAEITKDTDEYGNDIDDIDSTPGNKKDGEDDLDKERVHVGYFDLSLQKDLTKAVITEGDSTKEIAAVNGQLMKVEIHRKKVNSTIVKFVYKITVKNEGTIAGYAKEIKDYIPEGLQFVESDNQNWKASSDGVITTTALENTLIKPGETASVEVVLRWVNGESNLGMKTNIAEISKDYNDANDVDDIDSTPNNKKDGEDDIDNAPVILSISTGSSQKYIILTTAVLTIIGTGVVLIKKYVL